MSEFSTRMVWNGGGYWEVALSQVVDGRARQLATVPFDDWISLSATQEAIAAAAEMEPPEKIVGVHPVTGVIMRAPTNPGD